MTSHYFILARPRPGGDRQRQGRWWGIPECQLAQDHLKQKKEERGGTKITNRQRNKIRPPQQTLSKKSRFHRGTEERNSRRKVDRVRVDNQTGRQADLGDNADQKDAPNLRKEAKQT